MANNFPTSLGHVLCRVIFFSWIVGLSAVRAAKPEEAELEALRAQVVKALAAEIEKADPNEGRTLPLLEFALTRVREADPTRISTADLNRLAPDGRVPVNISEETRKLLGEFARAVRAENQRLQQDAAARYTGQVAAILRRAMAARDAGSATQIASEAGLLTGIWGEITSTRELSALQPNSVRTTLDLFAALHRFREVEDWRSFGSRLQQIIRKLDGLRGIFNEEEIRAFEISILALAGFPPLSQLEEAYPVALEALFDDERQAELPEMAAMIRRHAQVFIAITSSGPYEALALRWEGLAQFAEDFQQQVAQVREGKTPALRAERWTTASNASLRLPLSPEELEAKWQDYQVVIDDAGKCRVLLPDLDKLLAGITSLAEIEAALPDIQYAEQVLSAMRGSHSVLAPRLAQLAEIHAALESPERTVLHNELVALLNHTYMKWHYAHPGRAGGAPQMGKGHRALDRLFDQARRGMAGRMLGGAEIPAETELREALHERFERARKGGDWKDLLAVDRLTSLFFPQGGWLSHAERQAVDHLLAAERQASEFNQMRIAVFHLQLAISAVAELPGDALLRERLDEIRAASLAAYGQGTGDALAGKLGDQLPPATAWILPRLTR